MPRSGPLRQPLLAAISSPLKPITAIKFSMSVKHSQKQTVVSAETCSHWCLTSSGEAGVCSRSPLPSCFVPCDLTKSNRRTELSSALTQTRKKSQLVSGKDSFAFQLSPGPLSSSSSPWLLGSSKRHCSQLREGRGFLCCPVKAQETKSSCSLALITSGQDQVQDWQVAPAHSCNSPFCPYCTLKLMTVFGLGFQTTSQQLTASAQRCNDS